MSILIAFLRSSSSILSRFSVIEEDQSFEVFPMIRNKSLESLANLRGTCRNCDLYRKFTVF